MEGRGLSRPSSHIICYGATSICMYRPTRTRHVSSILPGNVVQVQRERVAVHPEGHDDVRYLDCQGVGWCMGCGIVEGETRRMVHPPTPCLPQSIYLCISAYIDLHTYTPLHTTHHGERPGEDGHVRLEALPVLRRHLPLPAPHQLRVALVPCVCVRGFDSIGLRQDSHLLR